MSEDGGGLKEHRITGVAAIITSLVESLSSIVKLVLIVALVSLAFANRTLVGPYISNWLLTLTHLQVGPNGLSLDRQVSAERAIAKIAQERAAGSALPQINVTFARGAVVRASRNAPALIGARVLWVDGNPQNNDLEAGILRDMGIEVRRARTTREALVLLPGFAPDLIISNVIREGDENPPLRNCPAHYFEVPPGVDGSLDALNAATMAGTGKATGFGMAETISGSFPDYVSHAQPRLIFYSASSGGRVVSQCARLTTNRADLLLQTVVSALEEIRWPRLEEAQSEAGR